MPASVDIITLSGNVEGYKAGENVNGRMRENTFDVTLSSSYPTSGYTLYNTALTAIRYGQLGMKTIIGVHTVGRNSAALLYTMVYDKQLKTLRVITAGAEIAQGVSLSTIVFRVLFFGAS